MPTIIPHSHQFPQQETKKQPASYSLLYRGIHIKEACLCSYPICASIRKQLVTAGTHQYNQFIIQPNY